MKIAIFAVLAVLGSALASSELTSSEERFISELQNYKGSAKEYVRNGMKDLAEAICENESTDLETPLNEVVRRAQEIDVEAETVCSLIKNHLVHVLEPLSIAIDGCLPHEEAGIAQYVVKAVASAVTYLCGLNGEHILELANPCIEDIDLESSKCIENVEDKWNQLTGSGKSFKEEACSEYNDIRPCLETEIHSKCKLSLTRSSILGLVDSAFKTPC